MAEALFIARASGEPILAFTQSRPDLGIDDGYSIQTQFTSLLEEAGEVICGYKLGLTSVPMQELMGVHEPDFGPVFSSTIHHDFAKLSAAAFISARIEAEIAIILDSELRGPGCTAEMVRSAARGMCASLEVVDSRIKDWNIAICDTVADLASGAAIVMGSSVVSCQQLEPRDVEMVLSRNGDVVGTGIGAATLGDPLVAAAWLVNVLGDRGVALPAGSIVMTWALHAMVPMSPGDEFRAEFEGLGSVAVTVVA